MAGRLADVLRKVLGEFTRFNVLHTVATMQLVIVLMMMRMMMMVSSFEGSHCTNR